MKSQIWSFLPKKKANTVGEDSEYYFSFFFFNTKKKQLNYSYDSL